MLSRDYEGKGAKDRITVVRQPLDTVAKKNCHEATIDDNRGQEDEQEVEDVRDEMCLQNIHEQGSTSRSLHLL